MRRYRTRELLAGLLFSSVAWGEESATATPTSAGNAPATTRHVVEIVGFRFLPERLTVSKGDTIVWINRDAAPHTVTAEDYGWDSGGLREGESWQWVADSDLAGAYFCQYHPGMKGVLELAPDH